MNQTNQIKFNKYGFRVVDRIIVVSGRKCPTVEYQDEPGVFYYRRRHSSVSGPFQIDDPRFRKV